MQADIVIKGRGGNLKANIEVKNKRNLTADAALFHYRSMMNNGFLANAPYFLMISQDVGFLWDDLEPSTISPNPKLEFVMQEVVRRYLPHLGEERLSSSELEFLVIQWLMDLIGLGSDVQTEPERSFTGIGFTEAILGGVVVSGNQI